RYGVVAGLAVGVVDRGRTRAPERVVVEIPLVGDDRAVAVARAAAVEVAGQAGAAEGEARSRWDVCRDAGHRYRLLQVRVAAGVVQDPEPDGVAARPGVGVLGGGAAHRAVAVAEIPLVLADRPVGIGRGAAVEAAREPRAAECEAGRRWDIRGRNRLRVRA